MNSSVVIVGRISSGKSTIAKTVIDFLPNSKVISFGGYLKHQCINHNLAIDRINLQNLGQSLIEENPRKFLIDVVNFNEPKINEILIFEGVRHTAIYNAVSQEFPILCSVFLDINLETRYKWYSERRKDIDGVISFEEFKARDNHIVENEIELLRTSCQLTLPENSISENSKRISDFIDI